MDGFYEVERDGVERICTVMNINNNMAAHFHECVELIYVLEGEFTANLDDQYITLGAGEVAICSSYTMHAYKSSCSKTYALMIPLSAVPSIRKLLLETNFSAYVYKDADGCLRCFFDLLHSNACGEIMQKGICLAILGLLIERVGVDVVGKETGGGLLRRMLGYLNSNFNKNIGVSGLARQFGLSHSYISHLIRSGVGLTLPQYMNSLRCRWVASQLLTTDRPIVELALDAGYHNVRTFYSAFHTIYGATPREYVRTKRAENEV